MSGSFCTHWFLIKGNNLSTLAFGPVTGLSYEPDLGKALPFLRVCGIGIPDIANVMSLINVHSRLMNFPQKSIY